MHKRALRPGQVRWIPVILILLLLAAGAAGYVYYQHAQSRFTIPILPVESPPGDIGAQVHHFCGGCHAYPALGGSSPKQNPQFEMAAAHGAHNRIPDFLKLDGPIRAVRLKSRSSVRKNPRLRSSPNSNGLLLGPNYIAD